MSSNLDNFMVKGKAVKLEKLKIQVRSCIRCEELIKSRKLYKFGKPTFGYGNINSEVIFIGEAPGKYGCGRTGKPFMGDRSGGLYLESLKEAGFNYEEVYTTNIVKCCPLNNRTPTKKEIENCRFWLEAEIKIINPKLIVAMGRTAANWLGIRESLSRARFKEYYWRSYRVYIRYHPAYILRCGPKMVQQYRGQFKILRGRVEGYDRIKVRMLKPLLKLKKGDITYLTRYEANALKKLNHVEEIE